VIHEASRSASSRRPRRASPSPLWRAARGVRLPNDHLARETRDSRIALQVQANKASEAIHLDEAATRKLIDNQLPDAG
jgi:hypothetical protein